MCALFPTSGTKCITLDKLVKQAVIYAGHVFVQTNILHDYNLMKYTETKSITYCTLSYAFIWVIHQCL
jgi:hypothetical protein